MVLYSVDRPSQFTTFALQGKYAEAEPLYERSQAIQEKALGPEHPDLAKSLDNRAVLLQKQVSPPSLDTSFFTRARHAS